MSAHPTSRPRVQLWCPELFGVGGIQAYSRHFLNGLLQSKDVHLTDVLTRNDEHLPATFSAPSGTRFSLCGRGGASASRLKFAASLLRIALSGRPNLIITTHLYFTPVARCLKRMARIPFWTIAHGVEAWDPLRRSHRTALRSADRILAVSRFTRDRISERPGVDAARVQILPNTFDPASFRPGPRPPELLARYGLRADQPIILTVARTEQRERYKGYDEILRVMPEISRMVPGAHYLLVGDGNDRGRIERMIADLGLTDSVTLAHGVSADELCAHYNLCDLFAMPSRLEGFGIVFLEALACGKPVLAGKFDGSVDPLRDGELGILVDPANASGLRDAIVDVLLKRHPHANIYRPDFLRQTVVDQFGLARFRATLDGQLAEFFRRAPADS